MAKEKGIDFVFAGILSSIMGALVFGACSFFSLGLIPSLGISFGVYVLALFLFKPRSDVPYISHAVKNQPNRSVLLAQAGLTESDIIEAIKDGRTKLNEMRLLANRIVNPLVQYKVKQIGDVTEKILDDIKQDPKDLRQARQFLNYYLDATIKILDRYTELSSKRLANPEVQASLKRVEGLLDTIRLAFEKQHAILLQDDVMDLDTELKLLQNTITYEGLGKD